jgi:hypothetical protein
MRLSDLLSRCWTHLSRLSGSPWAAVMMCFALWFVISCLAALLLGRWIRRADRLAGIRVDLEDEAQALSPHKPRLIWQQRADELRRSTRESSREADQSGTQLIQGPRTPTRSGAIRRFADPTYGGVRNARR